MLARSYRSSWIAPDALASLRSEHVLSEVVPQASDVTRYHLSQGSLVLLVKDNSTSQIRAETDSVSGGGTATLLRFPVAADEAIFCFEAASTGHLGMLVQFYRKSTE